MIFMSFSTDAALEGLPPQCTCEMCSPSGALLGGMGVAAFHLAATVGRLASSALLNRVGKRALLMLCGLSSASGMACVVLSGRPELAAAALLLVGVAAAPIAPVVFSLTARAVPKGERTGYLTGDRLGLCCLHSRTTTHWDRSRPHFLAHLVTLASRLRPGCGGCGEDLALVC